MVEPVSAAVTDDEVALIGDVPIDAHPAVRRVGIVRILTVIDVHGKWHSGADGIRRAELQGGDSGPHGVGTPAVCGLQTDQRDDQERQGKHEIATVVTHEDLLSNRRS
jgi:hypothetical protein